MPAAERLFRGQINPHGFRACAAMGCQAVPLLGFRSFATTEKPYVKADRLHAGRSVNAALKEVRGGERRKGKEAEGR